MELMVEGIDVKNHMKKALKRFKEHLAKMWKERETRAQNTLVL